MIKCLTCGFEYESAFQIDEESFKTAIIENRNETCPQCGVMSTYNKENYFFSQTEKSATCKSVDVLAMRTSIPVPVIHQVPGHALSHPCLLNQYVINPTREKISLLEAHYSFHELNVDDALSKIQIPKVDSYENQVFAIIHFPVIDKEQSMPRPTKLALFAGPDYLITIHQEELGPLSEAFQSCRDDPKQRELIMGNSPGYLLHTILDLLMDDLLHILMKVEGNLDDIEDLVFDEKTAVAREISMLRRERTTIRRIVYPLKRTILVISKEIQRFSTEDLTPYFDDVIDHIDRIVEVLDESKETIEIFKDTDFMLSTEKSNKILAILTILFTLSIPASVTAAYYGMNVNLPGGIETGSPTFLGEYTSLIILMLVAIVPVGFMTYWFRRQGWLKA